MLLFFFLSLFRGRLKSVHFDNICVDHLQRDEAHKLKSYVLGQYMCHAFQGNSQYFTLSKSSQLRNEYMCAKVDNLEVRMIGCDSAGSFATKWEWVPAKGQGQGGLLRHLSSDKCLKPDENHNGVNLLVGDCDQTNEKLLWQFDFSEDHPA